METQPSDPYFPIGKSSSMLQAINYFPVNTGITVQSTIEKPTILTPKNIMIGTGVICLLIVIVKSK